MLKIKDNFCLSHIKSAAGIKLPVKDGLVIKKMLADGSKVDIAYIYYDKEIDNCYIKTVSDNFQTYVVLYEQFQDFIYLIDEAYYSIGLVNNKPVEV